MDYSGYSGHWENRPNSDNYHDHHQEEDYNHYSPPDRNRRPQHPRPQTDYNLHTFKKTQPARNKRDLRNLPPKYFEIQPYLDNILSDEISENKEVQRTLKDLRSLNEQMLSELQGGGGERQEPAVRGNYWDEIQRLIMQIINNSQNETSEFKASLQHLKNLKDRTLQEDLDYYDEDGDHSYHDNSQRYQRRPPQYQREKVNRRQEARHGHGRPFSQTFEPRTENERRLMDEIMDLREENAFIQRRLNEEIDKNRYLSDRIYDLEDQSASGIGRGRSRFSDEQFNKLNQRVRQVDDQNHQLRQELRALRQKVSRSPDNRGNYRHILEGLNKLKHENNELRKDTVELLETKQGRSYENKFRIDQTPELDYNDNRRYNTRSYY